MERWRIFLRLRWRRLVLFFFHFHRNFARDFLYGLDLCAIVDAVLLTQRERSFLNAAAGE